MLKSKSRRGKPAFAIGPSSTSVGRCRLIDGVFASKAGVQIDLVPAAGICCCAPASPALSEKIRVKEHVGRFLENDRIVSFGTAGHCRRHLIEGVLSSARLDARNLDRRVELLSRGKNPTCNEKVLDQIMFATEG